MAAEAGLAEAMARAAEDLAAVADLADLAEEDPAAAGRAEVSKARNREHKDTMRRTYNHRKGEKL